MRFTAQKKANGIASSALLLSMLVVLCLRLSFAKDFSHKGHGLHAGIRAQYVSREPGVTHPDYVMVTVLLLNDGKTSLDVDAGSWALVIDGVELKDSGMLFGNGPMPTEGYKTLKPSDHYEFGKELEVARYFPHTGQHKISWRGKNFESPTITVETGATAP